MGEGEEVRVLQVMDEFLILLLFQFLAQPGSHRPGSSVPHLISSPLHHRYLLQCKHLFHYRIGGVKLVTVVSARCTRTRTRTNTGRYDSKKKTGSVGNTSDPGNDFHNNGRNCESEIHTVPYSTYRVNSNYLSTVSQAAAAAIQELSIITYRPSDRPSHLFIH